MQTTHDTMRILGHIARLVYTDRDIPQSLLDLLLLNPTLALPRLIKPPQSAAVKRLIEQLPEELPKNVSIEDQGGFWLTWYGQHGGARVGAGRPAEVDAPKRVNVMLDEETIERARDLGDGNLSAGIRAAVGAASAKPVIK